MEIQYSDRIKGLKASAIREILKFTADPTVISFAAGNPAPEAFPVKEIADITADIFKNDPITALQYSVTEGYPPLRETMKKYAKEQYGIGRVFDDLIIVSGAQQGIELTCKALCNEGDVVICEVPSFVGSLNSFKSFNAKLVGVPVEDGGISLEKLETTLKENPNTKLIYLIPNFQNPSGTCMSLEKRKGVYELAKKYGVMILEDNPYGDLRFGGEDIPSIKSFDEEGIVVYSGSFSKVLAPGLRVGYLIADKELIQKVVVGKQAADVHTNILAQMICDRYMKEYDMPAHLQELKKIYKKKCELMLSGIEKHFNPVIHYTRPEGGLFLWCTLPDGVDMMKFCANAVQNKVAVVPGVAFMPYEDVATQSFRLNFSTPTDEQIIKGVEILGGLTYQI